MPFSKIKREKEDISSIDLLILLFDSLFIQLIDELPSGMIRALETIPD